MLQLDVENDRLNQVCLTLLMYSTAYHGMNFFHQYYVYNYGACACMFMYVWNWSDKCNNT